MKKILFLLSILCSIFIGVSAQTNFSIKLYAGSNAPWGESQFLSIDAKSHVHYELSEVNKGVKDSSSFTITKSQMQDIEAVVNKIRFFSLNASYNSQSRDGTRLSVEVLQSGKSHSVSWINIQTNESTQLLDKLNSILKSRGINIHY